ncbi:MAG: bifunctional 4-hydroxy-2-oxoglutarate aldolase/2-dehydro-3-deoxy-phosphogluconate aldolase [Christensenellaceae bacterium]|nr:bifunctional 4-hydroxy-2-oxoglutarate aldolase/2-dehydro-3-deoxy-phosphogluconate aldolase [Christensenellaceae bacterium]
MDVLKELSYAGIIPVIKIDDASDAVPLCKALRDGGLPVAEITFRTEAAEEAIRQVHQELPDVVLGAGTVLNTDQVNKAVAAGASYIVSPGLNPKTVEHCKKIGVPIIAGCANPSDIEIAIELGLRTVKFFPAEALGGLKVIKALSGPFNQVSFVPTGGITEKNLLEYLSFEHIVACGGSWMVPNEAIKAKDWKKIEQMTRSAVTLMLGLELKHIGINVENEVQAKNAAILFGQLMGIQPEELEKSFFVNREFEIMKSNGRGKNGHIAIAVNNVERAIWHLKRRGFTFDDNSRRYNKGKTEYIYLSDEIAGFAIHLVEKQGA